MRLRLAFCLTLVYLVRSRQAEDSWDEPLVNELLAPAPPSRGHLRPLEKSKALSSLNALRTKKKLVEASRPDELVQLEASHSQSAMAPFKQTAGPTFIGCFKDVTTSEGTRAMKLSKANAPTIASCAKACRDDGYPFMGRQGANECRCSNDGYNKYGPTNACKCDDATNQGENTNCVYHTQAWKASVSIMDGGEVKQDDPITCSMPNGCNRPMNFPEQKEALLSLYQATNGASWQVPQGFEWNAETPMCTNWTGLSCDPWGRVVEIQLRESNLMGTIPDLSALSSLSFLDLATNQLSGSLPSFSFAKNLTYLWLNQNMFTGTIPVDLPQENLVQLELSHNLLSGPLPDEFSKLTRIKYLDLSANKLSALPNSTIDTFSKLIGTDENRTCNLGQNHFACPIPEDLQYPAPCGAMCGVYIENV